MKLFGQVAQEPLTRCGRGVCPVVVGAESPVIAGRGDGSIQGPLDAGVPALRGAGAHAPGHAALGVGHVVFAARGVTRTVAALAGRIPDRDVDRPHIRIDRIAGSGQENDPHHAVAGDEEIVRKAGRPHPAESRRIQLCPVR